MGLYLAVFDGQEELDGFEIGSYNDFDQFREKIAQTLEGEERGNLYPVYNYIPIAMVNGQL